MEALTTGYLLSKTPAPKVIDKEVLPSGWEREATSSCRSKLSQAALAKF
jgi:hypothetical protein